NSVPPATQTTVILIAAGTSRSRAPAALTSALCVFRPPLYHGAILESEFGGASQKGGTVHAKPSQLSIVVFRVVPSRRRWPSLARKSMGAARVPALEAARALPFRPE